jgi:alpha-L-rhamnosidase
LTWIASQAAQALGRTGEAAEYARRFERIRQDFNARFLSPDGIYRDKPGDPFTQTAQVLPLAFGLAPDHRREPLAQTLAHDITATRGGNPWVGVLGARYLLPVLTSAGRVDVAFTAATATDYPSWGYWVDELKWTALGEHWEATTRSRNHHFFGTIVQWMHEALGGVRPLAPGFRRIAFEPAMPAGLGRVATTYDSVRGRVASAWRRTPEGLELAITVPPTATGVVHVPAASPDLVIERGGGRAVRADAAEGVRLLRVESGRVVYEVGSGAYTFRVVHGRPRR